MDLTRLTQPGAPWLHLLTDLPAETEGALRQLEHGPRSVAVRLVRGWKATTVPDVYNEIAAAVQFPVTFGENWDALSDCLRDLAWLAADGLVIVLAGAAQLLAAESDVQFRKFCDVLALAARHWSHPPKGSPRPFHVVLVAPRDLSRAVEARWHKAKLKPDPLA
jgi:hypothetical protein